MSELHYKCYDTLGRASATISDLRRELRDRGSIINRLNSELEVIKGLYDIASDGYLRVKDQLDKTLGTVDHLSNSAIQMNNNFQQFSALYDKAVYESRQNTAREIFKNFDPWFTSGNAISVERATILTRDYLAIKARFGL